MSLEAKNNGTHDDDVNTTAPQSKPVEWAMPEPVFRKTSGKLPGSFVKEVMTSSAADTSIPPAAPTSPTTVSPTPEPRPKSPTLKIVVVLLGVAAMIAFLIVFLSVVYFFFLRGNSPTP